MSFFYWESIQNYCSFNDQNSLTFSLILFYVCGCACWAYIGHVLPYIDSFSICDAKGRPKTDDLNE